MPPTTLNSEEPLISGILNFLKGWISILQLSTGLPNSNPHILLGTQTSALPLSTKMQSLTRQFLKDMPTSQKRILLKIHILTKQGSKATQISVKHTLKAL